MSWDDDNDLILDAVRGRRVGRTGWVRVNCPVCVLREGTEDRRTSLGVSALTGWWRCWRCGGRGKVDPEEVQAAAAAPRQGRGRGASTSRGAATGSPRPLGALEGARVPPSLASPTKPLSGPARGPLGAPTLCDTAEAPPEALQPPEGWVELGHGVGSTAAATAPHRAYLAARGVLAPTVAAARVGAALRGPHRGRVLVPVLGLVGEWLGWSGRALSPRTLPRYRYPDGMGRGDLVWNGAALHQVTDEPALIVEGVFDGLRHWPDAVAVLGKPTDGQLPLLRTAARPIVVALDGDAWREGEALAWRLQLDGVRAVPLRLPPRSDPGDISKEELSAMARAALAKAS